MVIVRMATIFETTQGGIMLEHKFVMVVRTSLKTGVHLQFEDSS